MRIRQIKTVPEVIAAIGPDRVKLLTAKKSNNLTNWKASGFFPPETYAVLTAELARRRCQAPPSLWRQIDPTKTIAA